MCLFASHGHDLRAAARQLHDAQIGAAVAALWAGHDDRYSGGCAAPRRPTAAAASGVEMHYIGGEAVDDPRDDITGSDPRRRPRSTWAASTRARRTIRARRWRCACAAAPWVRRSAR